MACTINQPNPLENLWDIVNIKVNRESAHWDPKKFYHAINETWSAIPINIFENFISSMPKRCAEVMKNRSYATKYYIVPHNPICFVVLIFNLYLPFC